MYTLYIVVLWKYPGIEILSPIIQNLEIAKRTADLERAKNRDGEQDIFVLQVNDQHLYAGKFR